MCRVKYFPQERRRPNEKKKIWRRRVGEGEGGGEEECAGRWGAEGSLEGEGGKVGGRGLPMLQPACPGCVSGTETCTIGRITVN